MTLPKMNKKEIGIYIHIPFCKRKCYYCDFISFVDTKLIEEYVECVIKEINAYDLSLYNVTTIYLGGGTPSYISDKYIEKILNVIRKKMIKNKNETKFEDIEITIEVNPGTVNEEKLKKYYGCGINRLSIGLQTTNDMLLKLIGRIHTYSDFINTYNLAKNAGFNNINVDLMIGLPKQKIQDIKQSLEKIIDLEPTHISVYSLIVEEGTKISKMLENKQLELPDENLERQMYWYVKNTLELNGYNHYEISNFAKKGKESKHNVNCWKQKEYIGIGVSAHSYLNGIRYSNTISLKEYIKNMGKINYKLEENIENVYLVNEIQDLEDMKKEYMLLGLRMIEGVHISEFKEKFIDNPIFLYRKSLEKLVNENLIIIDGNDIRLTNKGLDLANLVWEEFI